MRSALSQAATRTGTSLPSTRCTYQPNAAHFAARGSIYRMRVEAPSAF